MVQVERREKKVLTKFSSNYILEVVSMSFGLRSLVKMHQTWCSVNKQFSERFDDNSLFIADGMKLHRRWKNGLNTSNLKRERFLHLKFPTIFILSLPLRYRNFHRSHAATWKESRWESCWLRVSPQPKHRCVIAIDLQPFDFFFFPQRLASFQQRVFLLC